MNKGMGGHQSANMKSDEWLTPPELLAQLGEFDLDPCAPVQRPWPTAKKHYTIIDDGLAQVWDGRVWMNPPYGKALALWLRKLSEHGNGIALTFTRTETKAFHPYVFDKADSIFFIEGRLSFYTVAGTKAKMNGGAPSCLIAYGERNVQALAETKIKGKHVPLNTIPMIVVAVSPTWKRVVTMALNRLNGQARVQEVYDLVERLAPDKVEQNQNYKAKVRQVLQECFTRISKGYYVSLTVEL